MHSPLWSQSRSSTDDILLLALAALQENHLIQQQDYKTLPVNLLIKEHWRVRIFIVFDICNTEYDAALGHLPEHNTLPVLVVHFGKSGVRCRTAELGIQRRVNRETCEKHNLNGVDSGPPYVVDRNVTIPVYMNPRDGSLLKAIRQQ